LNSSGEHSLSDYIDALTTFTALITLAGDIVLVNKSATKASGLSVENFIGKAFKSCHWWNFNRTTQDQLEQDIQECVLGKHIDREVKIQISYGQFLNIRFIMTPITDATGKIAYLVAEGQDITERSESLSNLSNYINALSTFTALLTPEGEVELVNKVAAEATGLPADSFIGKAFKNCYWWNFSPASQEQLAQNIHDCAIGKRIDREVKLQIAGGQFINIRFILTPITNATGKVTNLVAEGQDITERSEDLINLSNYINALSTFTVQLTPAGVITLVNKAAAEITGLSADSFIGKAAKDSYWWNFSREAQYQLEQDIKECATGKRIEHESEVQVIGGQLIHIRSILTPIFDTTGKVTYLVAEGQDITQRKQLELTLIQEKEIAVNLASHDSLTSLPNRRHFMEYAEDKISLAQRRGDKLALLYIDLDGFKAINDDINHQAGDIVLTTLGERFNRLVRKGEMIARLGGDEFAMLIYGYKKTEELDLIAKRLIELCSQSISIGERKVKVSLSIGISTFQDHAVNIDELLSRADEAMYKIKRTTKGSYAFAD